MSTQNIFEDKVNLTILMPCLNEEENIAFSIRQAQSYLR